MAPRVALVSLGNSKDIRFDKYHLLERISHGGMAEVFRAKTLGAEGFERDVAIKLLLPGMAEDEEFVTMLIDEAKIAGQLSHPNIAQIFDFGETEGRHYIVQEYVQGKDLRSIIRRCRTLKKPLSVAQSCHIMMRILDGLDYAHNRKDKNNQPLNLVHRDVSPQNVLVSLDGQVKLIDFGIAKAEGRATRTLAGLVKGKFAYMSPEQIRGLPLDRRSDVFACGIVLHELLTAQPLFLRKSEFETLQRTRSGDIAPPSTQNPEVPFDLDTVCLRALARQVEDRFQSAKEFRASLFEFVKNQGEFYSQDEISTWMRDTFGSPDDDSRTTAQQPAAPSPDDIMTAASAPVVNHLRSQPSAQMTVPGRSSSAIEHLAREASAIPSGRGGAATAGHSATENDSASAVVRDPVPKDAPKSKPRKRSRPVTRSGRSESSTPIGPQRTSLFAPRPANSGRAMSERADMTGPITRSSSTRRNMLVGGALVVLLCAIVASVSVAATSEGELGGPAPAASIPATN